MTAIQQFPDWLKQIGSIEPGDKAPDRPLPQNAHIHLPPNFSAFDTVNEAVDMAKSEGIAALLASNYYDHRIYECFARTCLDAKIYPVFGLEVILFDEDLARDHCRTNDPKNPGKMYLCGMGTVHFENPPGQSAAILSRVRSGDEQRMRRMVDKLNEYFAAVNVDIHLTYEQIVARLVDRHGVPADYIVLQERHLAQAYQEALTALVEKTGDVALYEKAFGAAPSEVGNPVAIQNDLRTHLMKAGRPAYVEEKFVSFEEAKAMILGLGGFPCYPLLLDGASPITEFEQTPEQVLEELRKRGVHMAQFIPRRNTLELLESYARFLRENGIVLTAGTEHNTLDRIPLVPACKGPMPLTDDMTQLFWEGMCVTVAHQHLKLRGEPGFVDEEGNIVNAPEQLAELGARWISRQARGR